ncbi:transmembrane protein 43-like [Tubulanus polymorphus]|uniref:transmembrane protein 43-like n=1 Tax=Tubulanus polymorphus TaxID=672921 RepID=UPI003DA1D7F7
MYRQHFPEAPGMHNMQDQHPTGTTRTTFRRQPTFGERVKNGLVAFLAGLALLATASYLLFWNEGRAVKTSKSLHEGINLVRNFQSFEVAFKENNGKLIYVHGPLRADKAVHDAEYDITVNAIKLKRHVEMYQWVEIESKREFEEDGQTRVETSYSYTQKWSSELTSSSSFHNPNGHHNPQSFPVTSKEDIAANPRVGNFHLSVGLTEKISDFQKFFPKSAPANKEVILHDGDFYHGINPLRPQIGDLKVTFSYAGLTDDSEKADTVSVIARQMGTNLLSYQTTIDGYDIELLYMGEHTPQEIFDKQLAHNTLVTWAFRFGGWLMMFIGFGCLTNIVTTLVDWIPILRDIIVLGVNMMNVCLSISLSLTIISISWIMYRPMIGMTILMIGISPFVWSRRRVNQSRYRSV